MKLYIKVSQDHHTNIPDLEITVDNWGEAEQNFKETLYTLNYECGIVDFTLINDCGTMSGQYQFSKSVAAKTDTPLFDSITWMERSGHSKYIKG